MCQRLARDFLEAGRRHGETWDSVVEECLPWVGLNHCSISKCIHGPQGQPLVLAHCRSGKLAALSCCSEARGQEPLFALAHCSATSKWSFEAHLASIRAPGAAICPCPLQPSTYMARSHVIASHGYPFVGEWSSAARSRNGRPSVSHVERATVEDADGHTLKKLGIVSK